MGLGDIVKILFLPALFALALYLLLTHLVLPLYRSHRERYANYLPLQTITSTSTTLRDRITNAFTNFVLPSHVRWRREVVDGRRGSGSGDELFFGEEEGESMVGFDLERVDRRVRGGHVSATPGRGGGFGDGRGRAEMDSQRRLSRDLEEGFKDDSEDEEGGDDRRR